MVRRTLAELEFDVRTPQNARNRNSQLQYTVTRDTSARHRRHHETPRALLALTRIARAFRCAWVEWVNLERARALMHTSAPEFWNLYLVEYNRKAMEITRIVIREEYLLPEDHDEYIAASFDNV